MTDTAELERRLSEATGQCTCVRCNGHGQVAHWSFGTMEPDECPDCGGSGLNWRYPSGAIAKYYGGPFLSGPSRRALATNPQEPT